MSSNKNSNNSDLDRSVLSNSSTKKACQSTIDFSTKQGNIEWVRLMNRPPYPVSAKQSLINNKSAKQPAYYKSKTFYAGLNWEGTQKWHTLDEGIKKDLIAEWHKDERTEGLGMIMGFNGEFHLISLDFDFQDFADDKAMEDAIDKWMTAYPGVGDAPSFRTQGGGWRFIFRSDKSIEDWSSHSNFTLEKGSQQRSGQLLNKNGGFTVMPPSIGETGNQYIWVKSPDPAKGYSPPLVNDPEEIGIYKVESSKKVTDLNEKRKEKDRSKITPKCKDIDQKFPFNQPVSLIAGLSPDNRNLLEGGVSEGNRNESLFKLAADLFGVANYLDSVGQSYEEDPEDLCWIFASRCTPPMDEAETQTTINSGRGGDPCLDEEKLINCFKAWHRKQYPQFYTRAPETTTQSKSKRSNKRAPERPDPNIIARGLASKYKDKWIYCEQFGSWLIYELKKSGVWNLAGIGYIHSIIDRELESQGILEYSSARYISDIEKLTKNKLFIREWDEKPQAELMPFKNGLLNTRTKEFFNHSPKNRLTWCLPRDYTHLDKDWGNIDKWLDEATDGNLKQKKLLIYFCAASLKGFSNLQKFLQLTGYGGTGKGLFSNYVTALIGEENTASIGFDELQDKHERYKLFGKRLIVMPDQDKLSGRLSYFKRLTGGDPIGARDLFKSAMEFTFKGLVLISSNHPITNTSEAWLKRRLLLANFNKVPRKPDPNMIDKLSEQLSGFTNYLLDIPEAEIKDYLLGDNSKPADADIWENMIDSDSLAAWVNDHIIFDQTAKTAIGGNANEWKTNKIQPGNPDSPSMITTLFGHYNFFCVNTNRKALGSKNFKSKFDELCTQVLRQDVRYQRFRIDDKQVRGFIGVRLRENHDPQLPIDELLIKNASRSVTRVTSQSGQEFRPVIEPVIRQFTSVTLENQNNNQNVRDTSQASRDTSCDGSKPLLYKECDTCDTSKQKKIKQVENQIATLDESDQKITEKQHRRLKAIIKANEFNQAQMQKMIIDVFGTDDYTQWGGVAYETLIGELETGSIDSKKHYLE